MPLQKYFKLFFNTTFSRIHNRLAGSSTPASSLKHLTSPHTEIERKTARKMPLGHNDERRTNPGDASPMSCVTFKQIRASPTEWNEQVISHTHAHSNPAVLPILQPTTSPYQM